MSDKFRAENQSRFGVEDPHWQVVVLVCVQQKYQEQYHRRKLKVGNCIKFLLRPDFTEVFEKKVIALYTFPTFEAVYEQFPEERINNVYQYYTREEEQKYGVVAIELK